MTSDHHDSVDVAYSTTSLGDDVPRVRLMCSLGGRILPRPHDNQLRYVGGDTRIVAVHRSSTFSALHDKLSKLAGLPDVAIKYQLPNEELDALISVTADDDVDNMLEEHDRLALGPPTAASGGGAAAINPRLRLFLFPPGADSGGFGSILDGSGSKRESWFIDVLNGGSCRGRGLERGRSDASSLVSEVPDYLFGLDNNSDEPKQQATWSPRYSSTSSVTAPPIPDLPPVRTKPESPLGPDGKQQQQQQHTGSGGYTAANPVWQYVPEPVPVYYMQGPPVPGTVRPFFMGGPPPMAAGGDQYRQPGQGVWTNNPNRSIPVYMGGPPPPAAYNYTAVAVDTTYDQVLAGGGGGGLLRNPSGMIPVVYPAAAPAAAASSPGESLGMEMRINRASQ